MNAEQLAILARKMMLTVTQAIALPATITHVASKMGWTESQAIETLMNHGPAREYVAGVVRFASQAI